MNTTGVVVVCDLLVEPSWLDGCDTIADVLVSLRERDIWPGAEVLLDGRQESQYYIGPVLGVDGKRFQLDCYDATGEWEAVYEIGLADLFKIEFGDTYSERFNEYMRGNNPKREYERR